MKLRIFLLCLVASLGYSFEILEQSYVEPSGDQPMNHGSSIIELSDGSLYSCWFGGTKEAHKDTKIFCKKKSANKKDWGEKKVVVDRQERPVYPNGPKYRYVKGKKRERRPPVNAKVGNTVLYEDQSGFFWLFYTVIPKPFGGWGGSNIQYKVSSDLGETWSPGYPLDMGIGALVKNKVFELSKDTILLPAYNENGKPFKFKKYSFIWHLKIENGKIIKKKKKRIPGLNHLQPSISRLDDNTLVAYMRNRERGKTYFSKYDIEKGKWEKARLIDIPNSNSPLTSITNNKGEIVIAFNNSPERPRTPLTIAKSTDGENFEILFNVEGDLTKDFAYPCLIQSKSGEYHLTYSSNLRDAIKHTVFTLD